LNHRCLDVSQESCRWTTGLYFVQWTHRELHSDFRCAEPTSSCWTMSPISSGGWNRTNVLLVQSQASLPTATAPECYCSQFGEEGSNLRLLIQSQEAYR